MSDPQWLQIAKSLPYGSRRKITCCSSGPSMIVEHSSKGFRSYCFRDASHGGFVPHGMLSIEDLSRRRQDLENLLTSRWMGLPSDFTLDVPPRSMIWLLKAAVGYDLARQYGIGYSPKLDRVVLPVHEEGTLVAFVARATDKQQPKYIARYKNDPSAVFTAGTGGGRFDCVYTEDMLSAIRVGRYNLTRSILGTAADEGRSVSLLQGLPAVPRVAVWLDGDKAGRKGRDKLARRLSLIGAEVTKINTPKDPKLYSNREIQEILANAG